MWKYTLNEGRHMNTKEENYQLYGQLFPVSLDVPTGGILNAIQFAEGCIHITQRNIKNKTKIKF